MLIYNQTCSKDHLFTKTMLHFTGPQGYTFHVTVLNMHIKTACGYGPPFVGP